MSSFLRKILVCSLAVFAVSAVASASASAELPAWEVEGVETAAEEKLVENVEVKEEPTLSGGGIAVTCSTLHAKEAAIWNKEHEPLTLKDGESKAHSLEFSDAAEVGQAKPCDVTNEANCEIVEPISTVEVVNQLTEAGGKAFVEFKPKTGTTFTTIVLVAKPNHTCLQAGSYVVKGTVKAEIVLPDTEAVKKCIKFTTTSGSNLTVAGAAATFVGEFCLELTSGKTWSVADSET